MRVFLTALALLAGSGALACEGLVVEHAWLRQPPPGSDVAAAYFDARNDGVAALTVQAVSSPDFKGAMLHATQVVAGRAEMRPQGDIELAPGAHFVAAPGGAHVMLFEPSKPPAVGDTLRLQFRCAKGEPLDIALPVSRDAPR